MKIGKLLCLHFLLDFLLSIIIIKKKMNHFFYYYYKFIIFTVIFQLEFCFNFLYNSDLVGEDTDFCCL